MELIELKEDIKKLTYLVKPIMNADIVVVDSHLNSIVNTFEYEVKPIDVQTNSVVGTVIVTGQTKIVKNKSEFKECVNCPQFEECEITSIIGVPINIANGCIGAIALLLRKEDKEKYHWSFEDALKYLEQIAGMFANRIQNRVYRRDMKNSAELFRTLLGYMKEAVALTDEQKRIILYNKRFQKFFGDEQELKEKNIEELMNEKSCVESNDLQEYGLGACFKKPGSISLQLALLQKIEELNGQERYLYVFENINISVLRKRQAKMYNLKGWIEKSFFGISTDMEVAKSAAKQASENALSILIEGPYKSQNDELGRMYLLKCAADGEGILEIDCGKDARVIEQELFGIGKNSQGSLEMAKGRIICLYSIHRMPLYLQNKVVEYLLDNQLQGEYGRNIRIIVTCEKNLGSLAEKGLFLSKLYYYVSRNRIQIPQINQKDIKYFFEKYLRYYGNIYNKPEIRVKEDVWNYLEQCDWEEGSGSIRQFSELLVMNLGGNIVTVDMVKMIQVKYRLTDIGGIEDENEEKIRELLMYSGKSKKEIAEELGIGRATLYRWIKKYNL